MVRYCFTQGDLLRTRFAIAPLMELVGAVYALRDPARVAVHRPWVEWAKPRVAALDVSLLDAAAPVAPHGFWPVFIGPPPRAPHAHVTDELARVRATPPEQVVVETTHAYPAGVPPAAQPFLDDPDAALERLVEQMRAFWDAVLAPWWPRISAALEAEISARARALVALGPQAAFHRTAPRRQVGGRHRLRVPDQEGCHRRRPRRSRPPARARRLHVAECLATNRPTVGPRPRLPTTRHGRPLAARSTARRGAQKRFWASAAPESCSSSTARPAHCNSHGACT